MLFPLAVLDGFLLAMWRDKGPGQLRAWAVRLALQVPVFVLILAPFVLYNHQVTGYWLPTSFYSKVRPAYVTARAGRTVGHDPRLLTP